MWGNCSFLKKSSETNSVFFGEDGQISTGLVRLPISKEFSLAQHFLEQAMALDAFPHLGCWQGSP